MERYLYHSFQNRSNQKGATTTSAEGETEASAPEEGVNSSEETGSLETGEGGAGTEVDSGEGQVGEDEEGEDGATAAAGGRRRRPFTPGATQTIYTKNRWRSWQRPTESHRTSLPLEE